MQKRLIQVGLGLLVLGYAAFNEYRLWNYDHVQWDAEAAVCHVYPDHCK
jgi:hypothetical protein